MKMIEINGIGGLFYELYNPIDFNKLKYDNADDFFRNWNNVFWKELLSERFIDLLIDKIDNTNYEQLSIWERAVLCNKKIFRENVRAAAKKISQYSLSQKELFSTLETLSIYCKLINKYMFSPFSLSLQDGIETGNDNSFSNLSKSLEVPTYCKTFLMEMIQPYLINVDFVWINGTLNYANLLAIKCLRELNPDVFVGVKYHESEYFSYNKIEEYLEKNQPLFDMIDCIVLDNCEDTIKQVEKKYCNPNELKTVGNILFKNRANGQIEKTDLCKNVYKILDYAKMPFIADKNLRLRSSPIVNMRVFANKSCYWHKCAFCGINKKYKYQDPDICSCESIAPALDLIEKYVRIGYTYFWFEDEALEKENLLSFASLLLEKGMRIFWQVRTRFDGTYNANDCKFLYNAGLREIRFGYESGDKDVLKSMNKYPADFDYDIIEQNIKLFSQAGIHVHLPVILGFPTETSAQKTKTVTDLMRLHASYNVSFNLNRFLLDVSSDAYRNFYKYQIFELHLPTTYSDFLGNFASFNYNNSVQPIDKERMNVMREVLYPWMPDTALLSSVIFYRLSEASRMTLLWATWATENTDKPSEPSRDLLNENISIIPHGESVLVYNWDNHYIVSYDPDTFKKLQLHDLASLSAQAIRESYEKGILI